MIHTIQVENIKCGGCMNSIKTALMKISGVRSVDIDKDKESVTIDSDVEKSILVEVLTKLGYPELGNNSVLQKAKSYVSCAVGNLTTEN